MAESKTKTGQKHGFQPGRSGNPGGRPKQSVHVRDLARAWTDEAIRVASEILRDEEAAPSVRLGAAELLLDRGWGRPAQAVEVSGPEGEPIRASLFDGLPDDVIDALQQKRARS